jgi:glutamine synthetase
MKIVAEYIWLDAKMMLRSKSRTLTDFLGPEPNAFPTWDFDGSSTGQATGNKSEIILVPRAVFPDPLRKWKNCATYLVLCDTYSGVESTPALGNHRSAAIEIFSKCTDQKPWYGLEQEYVLYKNGRPLGWPSDHDPAPQGDYYCGVGTNTGRQIADAHYYACLEANLSVSGINAEVMLGQWEFQIGPCEGIQAGDQMWIARYLLGRVCEQYGIEYSLDPKCVAGDWNGSGCHINFSTVEMRESAVGLCKIWDAVEKLKQKHAEHLQVYGTNDARLTGAHETSSKEVFTAGVADRSASVRVPTKTSRDGRGYLEDRRPASDIDPYLATAKIAETVCLDD